MRSLYRLAEVMERLSLSHTQAYREMSAGRLAYIQRGNQRLFEPEAIEAYVARLKATGGVERLLELVDGDGRIEVAHIPEDATLSDLAKLKRLIAERKAAA